MIRVYVAESLVDGQLLVDLLDDAGVPSELFHQNGSGALGELPVVYPEVWICRNLDIDKATNVIAKFSTPRNLEESITCESCGEKNPGAFEICWLCHQSLPVTDK